MKKKIITFVTVATLSGGTFVGCGKGTDDKTTETKVELSEERVSTEMDTSEGTTEEISEVISTETTEATEENALIKNEDGSYAFRCDDLECEYSGRIDYIPPEGAELSQERRDFCELFYNGSTVDIIVLEGNEYTTQIGIEHESANGVIDTPAGDMTYVIDVNRFFGFTAIYGFLDIDPGHYLRISVTVYDYEDEGVDFDWLIQELKNHAQGLKTAQ